MTGRRSAGLADTGRAGLPPGSPCENVRFALLLVVLALGTMARADAGLELADGWRYHADPKGAGVAGRWDGISLDDRRWTHLALGATGTGRAGWWRRWVDLPAEWPRVWIAVDGAAAGTDLFINGTPAVSDLARLALASGTAARDITALVHGRRRFLVALRTGVSPTRVRVAPAPDGWLAGEVDRLRIAVQTAPDLPWPEWLRGAGAAWTAYAPFAGGPAGRIGWKGDLEAGGGLAGVSCWVWDRAARRLLSGPALPAHLAVLRLADRILPLPEARLGGEARSIRLSLRVWPHVIPGEPPLPVGVVEATVENLTGHPREVDLLVAVHPFPPSGAPVAIANIRYDRATQAFQVDGRPVCVLAGAPDAVGTGAFGAGWDPVAALARGEFPEAVETADPDRRLATGVAAYRLRLQPYGGRTQTFRVLPGAPATLGVERARAARELDRRSAREDEETAWRRSLAGKERIFLRVPDKPAQDAFLASLGHLLVARAAGDPAARTPEADAALTCAGILPGADPAAFDPPGGMATATGFAAASPGAGPAREVVPPPAEAFAQARAAVRAGDGDRAVALLDRWLARPTTPGTYAWAQRVDPLTFRHAGGALPDPAAAARLVLTLRAMVLHEADGALWLAPVLPADWAKPGAVVDIRHAPTAFGILPGYALRASPGGLELRYVTPEQIAFRGRGPRIDPAAVAAPPAGYRWRIPGRRRIRLVRVDGVTRRDIPADRVVVLPPDFRRAFAGW